MQLATRISSLLDKRVHKLPASAELSDAMAEKMQLQLSRALARDIWRRSAARQPLVHKAIAGSINMMIRLLNHAKKLDDAKLEDAVSTAAQKIFSAHGASHVKPQFLSDLFGRQPRVGWPCARAVGESACQARTQYLRAAGIDVLVAISRTTRASVSSGALSSQEQLQGLADAAAAVLRGAVLDAAGSGSEAAEQQQATADWNVGRVKEVLQSTNTVVTTVKRGLMGGGHEFVVPDYTKLREVLTVVEKEAAKHPKSKPVQSLFTTLKRVTEKADAAKPTSGSKRTRKAATPEKKKTVADGNSGNKKDSPRSKKRHKAEK